MLGHIRGGVVIGESMIKFPDCTHSEQMTVSIISWWYFIFTYRLMTYTLPDMKETNWIGKIPPNVPL